MRLEEISHGLSKKQERFGINQEMFKESPGGTPSELVLEFQPKIWDKIDTHLWVH